MGPIAAGTVVVVCEPTPLGPIADGLVAVRAGLVPPGPGVVAGVKLDSASAGIPHRYVPLHHGGAWMMVLNRWLLEQDWCPLEPFAAAGPIAAGPEPDVGAAGVNLTPPGPGSFTATFLCITVGRTMPSSLTGFEPPLGTGSARDASAASGGLMVSDVAGDAPEFLCSEPCLSPRHVLRDLRIRRTN